MPVDPSHVELHAVLVDPSLDVDLLRWPYNCFIRELYNSRRRLRPIMHPANMAA